MYDSLINKMDEHFSDIGSILYSKACDFSKLHDISIEDIEMYYDLLCSKESFPENINRKNHKMCCLYYLSKDNQEYRDVFMEKYLGTIDVNKLGKNPENLMMIFNIIEFDKSYLNSPINNLKFLYELLKMFSNFETDFNNYIIYKYYRGYLKFRLGDIEQANREYLEIVSEIIGNEDFFLKYIKLLNDLLKVQMSHVLRRTSRADVNEYIQFLKELFEEVKNNNKTLALKIGFDLFSAYLEGKVFNKCIELLLEMKKILKKDLLRGANMKNGIDYYLSIASRLGYMGILLYDKKYIESASKKIRKALIIIGSSNNDKKTNDLIKAYRFYLANLEIWLTQETKYDIKNLASEFQKIFLPDLKSNAYKNYIVNEKNKESIIMDLKVINNMNNDIYTISKSIKESCMKNLQEHNNLTIKNFIIILSFYHDKIFRYSESYLTDKNEKQHNYYKERIKFYFKEANTMINKYIDDPFFKIPYAKILIINIYSCYANILLLEKDKDKIKEIINEMMDNEQNNLRSKLKIDKSIPSYGLWLKIKGDYYLQLKHFEAAIESYKSALKTLGNDHPKIPLILFNWGCAYFFLKKKTEAIEYLNRSINAFSNMVRNNNYFGIVEDLDVIRKKISTAKTLVEALSKQK